MDFFRDLFDAFIPHPDNGYKPNFFRLKAVVFTAFCVLILAVGVFTIQTAMVKNTSLAAVISSVLINLTNTDRSTNGLSELALNPVLTEAAQLKANDMAAKGYFAHVSPDGVTPWHWFGVAGYNFEYAGENLAVRFSDSIDVEQAWMNSPTHRANILNSHFTEIGIGIAQGTYKGEPTVFVVQMFGRPAESAPAPAINPQQASSSPSAIGSGGIGAVAGTSTEENPRVILQDDTFIAVKNSATTTYPALATTAPEQVSAWSTLFTSPKTVASAVFLFLALLVLLGLIVMVVVEIRHQHPWNVLLGVLLFLFILAVLYFFQHYAGGELIVT